MRVRQQRVSGNAQRLFVLVAVLAAAAALTLMLSPIKTIADEGNSFSVDNHRLSFICRGDISYYDEVCGDRSLKATTERRRLGASGLALAAVGLGGVALYSRRRHRHPCRSW